MGQARRRRSASSSGLRNRTQALAPCSITALVGVNGSGKTTTFRIILGLAKPDAGTGTLLGTDVTQLPNSVKRRVGAVLADSSFDAAFTGTDVIRQAKAFYPTFNATLCRTLLTRFSLPEDKPMSDFSTGMTAKFKTIIAMSHEPDVLRFPKTSR